MNNTQKELNKQLFDLLNISYQVTLEKVEKLLEAGASSKAVDEYGFTLLHKAVQTKNTELGIKIIELLIDKYGANINAVTNTGVTPLHLALIDNPGIAKFLLFQRKVSTEVFSEGASNPLIYAIQCGNRESAEIMIQHTVLQNPDYPRPDDITNEVSELSEHWDKCLEMEKMQHEILGNSNVSLYQFLCEPDEKKLADYLSNESTGVREELKGGLYTERYNWIYPLCARDIQSQYDKGMERRELLSGCEQFLKKDSSGILSEDLAYELAKKVVDSKVMKADVENFMISKGQGVV